MSDQMRRFLVECGDRHCPNALVLLVASTEVALEGAHERGWVGEAAALRCPTHGQENP